jgi:peptidoglycan-N-acetylglucosamine deacetylase
LKTCLVLLVSLLAALAQGKEIALTFDDCPMADGQFYTGEERTDLLVKKLKHLKVPSAAFFCNTWNLDSVGKKRLGKYATAGHVIANHTANHMDFHKRNTADFIAEIEEAHGKLSHFSTFQKWFRFPYLREGDSLAKRDALRAYLASKGYLNGYVTVDTYDWYLNGAFQRALTEKKSVDFGKLKKTYVKVLSEGVDFYDAIARRALKRSPRHVLLLHENDLAALYIDALVEKLRLNGWTIISPKSAYEDPLVEECPDTLMLGQGRVVAIAKTLGDTGPFWIWEDERELDRLLEKERVFH